MPGDRQPTTDNLGFHSDPSPTARHNTTRPRSCVGRTRLPAIPQAPVRLVRPTRRGDCYQWEVTACPYCGRKHRHGAGDEPDQVNRFLGHRVAHCTGYDPCGVGYYLARADREA